MAVVCFGRMYLFDRRILEPIYQTSRSFLDLMNDVSYDSLLGAIRSLLVLIFLKILFFSKFQVKGKILKGIVKLIHGYFFCILFTNCYVAKFKVFLPQNFQLKQAFLYFRLQYNIGFTNYIRTGLKC